MVDRLMAQQLWPGNKAPLLFADVEFFVSGVVFKAHRAIVNARSAVKFFYTGQLGTPCFTNIELGYCADMYEVKTLSDLCN